MGRAVLLSGSLASLTARAGGPHRPQELTPEEQRAEAIRARWQETGLAASAEMIDAICRDDPELAGSAREALTEAGERALPILERAASDPRCHLAPTVAAIVCASGAGQVELQAMLRAPAEPVASTALGALAAIAKAQKPPGCARGASILPSVMPALRDLLRAASGRTLEQTIEVARAMGPQAAPLVPELIAALDGPEVASNIAAAALAAVGSAAAGAVPKLRGLLARGGKWRYRAVEALGGIGEPARAALPDFAPLLERTIPNVCRTPGTYTEDDVTASAIQVATVHIGGRDAEPLVANLAVAFVRMRDCRLIAGMEAHWIDGFGALGRDGKRAVPLLLSILFDGDARIEHRRRALTALDRIEPLLTGPTPVGSARVRETRRALDRKREVFERPGPGGGGVQQQWHPPPPTATPRTFALCREEAGLPPLPEPPGTPLPKDPDSWWLHDSFGRCVESRLCGPAPADYRATILKCCASYGSERPWFCSSP